jgi:outer membrane protein OmpA-like peptidoglycan-associated protein
MVDGQQGHLRSVYFFADSDVLIQDSRFALDEVGRDLAADSGLRLIVRAYTTPARTAEGRLQVSMDRAAFCREYLSRSYGIAASRISSFYYGSERTPVQADDDWESLRCVELIIIE